MELQFSEWLQPWLLIAWIGVLSFFFAKVEIHIEGGAGWAAKLPTWRIEKHWLLDIFWGGRSMTGYHAWVFPFITFAFHLPFFIHGRWTLQLEARILGGLMLFWILEDFFWFVLNPAFGIKKFRPQFIPWHPCWFFLVPVEYAVFSVVGCFLMWYSFC